MHASFAFTPHRATPDRQVFTVVLVQCVRERIDWDSVSNEGVLLTVDRTVRVDGIIVIVFSFSASYRVRTGQYTPMGVYAHSSRIR